MTPSLDHIRHFVLDMDGTIYLGNAVFSSTAPFLSLLDELQIGFTFVTNNNSCDCATYAARLREMGIAATEDRIYTSASATMAYLRSAMPAVKRLYVVGTDALRREFCDAGWQCVDDGPEAVVVGFDTGFTFERLSCAAYWISRSLPYIATHPDRVCPTDRAIVLPDCGAVCALLESATGRQPDVVPGKPNPLMLEGVCQRTGMQPNEVAVVGDRVYTDMRMARDVGALAILTLTGETKASDLAKLSRDTCPDMVIEGLHELVQQLERRR